MFIDELNEKECWDLWEKIHFEPVKTARLLFPDRPKNYVKYTKDIGNYCANRGTALSLSDGEKIKVYSKICAKIWCDLPEKYRSIKLV